MHVFIAYPFTQLVDEDTNRISFEKQVFLEKTRELVMKKGHTVFLAHYRELWGKNLMSADECTPADYAEMQKADVIRAFPGEQTPSGGVMIELGWASSLGKKIILFCENNTRYSPLVYGLHALGNVRLITYNTETVDDVIEEIIKEEL